MVAVMSDLHDNVAAWKLMVPILAAKNIRTLINCGDTVAPAMLQEMANTFTGEVHTVFGNNADRDLELEVVAELPNVIHHGQQGAIDLEGQRIGFVHFPEVAMAMALTGEFRVVCHGHTHLKRWEKRGDCYLLNPGTAGGMFAYPSFALLDVATMSNSFIDLRT